MVLGIIPARYASTRFPGKPLVDIAGKSMIRRVYEQARACNALDMVVVATDDERIRDHVEAFGGTVEMTAEYHSSGTDRCAEVAWRYADASLVINIQGDEPFIHPEQIGSLVQLMVDAPQFEIATLAKEISDPELLFNPNIVKVVFTTRQGAMYFSRQTIPYLRGFEQDEWLGKQTFYKHIGLYGFRRKALLEVASLPAGHYEQAESLEQLRWLENGYRIAVGVTPWESSGIDVPEDIARILSQR
ncbi:MAG: 3-deoxy-manno-octulosonate cytidylyltransferase [Saprospiraceae bacterium]|nr:3-deoxy-manno-octulosonate cytidylyltransferase [Saprospiraceae bacterium]